MLPQKLEVFPPGQAPLHPNAHHATPASRVKARRQGQLLFSTGG